MNKGTEKQEKEYELDGEEASIWIAGLKIVEGNWTLEIEALGAI